jgi:hypothetical protein
MRRKDACWALLGDFNREPELLRQLPKDTQTLNSAQATHQGGGELDYMVALNKNGCSDNISATVLPGMSSDHLPVKFEYPVQFKAAKK